MTIIYATPLTCCVVEQLANVSVDGPTDVALPGPILLLITGMAFIFGIGLGVSVEQTNLRARERALAKGRRLLAAQARGLQKQLQHFYRERDAFIAEQRAAQPKRQPEDH